ncbi:MAG: hypothetical protein ACKVOH_00245 [Chlamydiales bacterium]
MTVLMDALAADFAIFSTRVGNEYGPLRINERVDARLDGFWMAYRTYAFILPTKQAQREFCNTYSKHTVGLQCQFSSEVIRRKAVITVLRVNDLIMNPMNSYLAGLGIRNLMIFVVPLPSLHSVCIRVFPLPETAPEVIAESIWAEFVSRLPLGCSVHSFLDQSCTGELEYFVQIDMQPIEKDVDIDCVFPMPQAEVMPLESISMPDDLSFDEAAASVQCDFSFITASSDDTASGRSVCQTEQFLKIAMLGIGWGCGLLSKTEADIWQPKV